MPRRPGVGAPDRKRSTSDGGPGEVSSPGPPMASPLSISVVVPVFEEEDNLVPLHAEIARALDEPR